MGILRVALVRVELRYWGATVSVVNMGEHVDTLRLNIFVQLDAGLCVYAPGDPHQCLDQPRRV